MVWIGLRFLSWRGPVALAVFAAGLTALRFGVGVTDRGGMPGADVMTHIYYTLGLFVLGGMDLGVPVGGPGWARGLLWLCYFAAPAITTTAVVEGVVRAIRSQGLFARVPRRHVVIAGAGKLAEIYLERLRATHRRKQVLLVELRPNEANVDLFEHRLDATVVTGDITHDAVLSSLNLDRAERVLLLTGDDFANLDAGARIRQLSPQTPLVVHVSDIRMARLVAEGELLGDCEVFNSHHIAARHMVETKILAHFRETVPRDVVVLAGFGRFGQTVLSELQEQAAGAFETVIIVDRAAGKLAAEFEEQMGFAGTYTHHVIDGDVEDPEIWHRLEAEIGFEHVVPVFVLGSGDDATNVRTAMWLTRRFPKAYVIARTFRESAFAESAARKLKFDIVSVAGLLRTSMPKRWFRFFRSLGDRLDVP